MPVRVVAGRAFEQPERVFDAEIFPESLVVFGARQARVANLDRRMEITFLRREQRAAAVHLDAAAFEHKIADRGSRIVD